MGFVWFVSGVELFRLSLAFSKRNGSNSFKLASQALVSTALITSVPPAGHSPTSPKPFQEGDTDPTQRPNEELTNVDPRSWRTWGPGHVTGLLCVWNPASFEEGKVLG